MPGVYLVIVCHDDESRHKAEALAKTHFSNRFFPRTQVVVIKPDSKYFENQIWKHLENTRHEWSSYDYVGMITYNMENKVRDLTDIKKHIAGVLDGKIQGGDVITMFNIDFVIKTDTNTNKRCTLLQGAKHFHGPYFRMAWNVLLDRLGYTRDYQLEDVENRMPPFFCNYWIARPTWMLKYLEAVKQAMAIMDTDPILIEYLHKNSGYNGRLSKEKLLAMSGKPYYTMHTFILERFPSFFFTYNGAKIVRVGSTMKHTIPIS